MTSQTPHRFLLQIPALLASTASSRLFPRRSSTCPSTVPDTEYGSVNACWVNWWRVGWTSIYLHNYMYESTTCFSVQRRNLPILLCGVLWVPLMNSLESLAALTGAGLLEQGQAAHRLIPAGYPASVTRRQLSTILFELTGQFKKQKNNNRKPAN